MADGCFAVRAGKPEPRSRFMQLCGANFMMAKAGQFPRGQSQCPIDCRINVAYSDVHDVDSMDWDHPASLLWKHGKTNSLAERFFLFMAFCAADIDIIIMHSRAFHR